MDEKQIREISAFIVGSILEEIRENKNPSSYRDSMYFYPNDAIFIYYDQWVQNEVALWMIENQILVYSGIHKHQGEPMPRYKLDPIQVYD